MFHFHFGGRYWKQVLIGRKAPNHIITQSVDSISVDAWTGIGIYTVHHVQGSGEPGTTLFTSIINIATPSGWNDSPTLPPQTFCPVA